MRRKKTRAHGEKKIRKKRRMRGKRNMTWVQTPITKTGKGEGKNRRGSWPGKLESCP